VISEGFPSAPEVVYSLSVPACESISNRFAPDTSKLGAKPDPVISEAFTVDPEVVYSPIAQVSLVGLSLTTNRFDPETVMLITEFGPEIEIKDG
jgi:hypothetical protein